MIVSGVHRIDGIVNGTTNFILSQMIHEGASYADALAEAQALGYAEADPTEDVTGGDAAAKIAILASIAFHTRVRLEEVDYVGIDGLDLADVAHAAELGYSVKLIASALQSGRPASRPACTPACSRNDHPLASVEGAFNAVHAARRVDPRGDPDRARRRRRGDRDCGDRRPAGGDRHPRHRIPAARRLLPRRSSGCRSSDLESPFYLRFLSTTSRACWPRSPRRSAITGVVGRPGRRSTPRPSGVHIVILTHSAREGSVRDRGRGGRRQRLQPRGAGRAADPRALAALRRPARVRRPGSG